MKFEQLPKWAQDEAHNGKYYMSYPNMTVTFTREQVLQGAKMDKEKERKEFEEIEEIYDIIASDIDINILEGDFDKIDYEFVGIKRAAKEIISAGYRKADDVSKETAKDIAAWLEFRYWYGEPNTQNLVLAKLIRTAYGVEVDE